jgi:hypothetical protein
MANANGNKKLVKRKPSISKDWEGNNIKQHLQRHCSQQASYPPGEANDFG